MFLCAPNDLHGHHNSLIQAFAHCKCAVNIFQPFWQNGSVKSFQVANMYIVAMYCTLNWLRPVVFTQRSNSWEGTNMAFGEHIR